MDWIERRRIRSRTCQALSQLRRQLALDLVADHDCYGRCCMVFVDVDGGREHDLEDGDGDCGEFEAGFWGTMEVGKAQGDAMRGLESARRRWMSVRDVIREVDAGLEVSRTL